MSVKMVAAILSIYFLVLNMVPCGDSASMEGDMQVVLAIDYDGGHGHDCEPCSPFCQCHCCHSHTVVFGVLDFESLTESISGEDYVHLDSNYYSYLSFSFQPPRSSSV